MPRYNYTCTKDPKCKVKDVPEALSEKLVICIGALDNEQHAQTQAELMDTPAADPRPEPVDGVRPEPAPQPEIDLKESFLVWEEEHLMFAEVDIRCPVCQSKATKSYADYFFQGYVRGNGYFDRAGCRRDMNLYKLTRDDPYAMYRVPGETDDIARRLRMGGKRNPRRQYFGPK